jgi:iron complex outermembrane receptor protein
MKLISKRVLFSTAALLPFVFIASANAQTAPAGQPDAEASSGGLGEITVTARKRKESLLHVPVAITALSSDMLKTENIRTVEQIVAVTPGMNLNNATTGSARSDRSENALIIRGMAPSRGNQTTSVFVNGVPVSDGIVTGVFDYDRVEVLKGPQSAYFGRETFAGAVNLVTAEPTDHFTGYVDGTIATGNYYDIKGALGGPIIADLLEFRASARYYSRDGTWKNAAEPGQTLGDQSTRSGSLELKLTPAYNLTVKLFGVISNDSDGVGATGVLTPDQQNCTIGSNQYFCGTLPALAANQPSARTAITPGIADMLKNYSPLFAGKDNIDHFGLERNTYHLSAAIDYDVGHGITASSLTGYNHDDWQVLYPLNGYASPHLAPVTGGDFQTYTDWPFNIQHKQRDFSQEFRLASSQNQRFRWLIGASYLWAEAREAYAQIYYFSGPSDDFSPTSESKTLGGFFGLAYDITPKLTLDFDGRYQSDKVISRTGSTGIIGYQKTYGNFVPRVSVEFKPDSRNLLYATYSQGVNPGLALDPLLAVPADYVATLQAMGITAGVKPEKLANYELGYKGRMFNDRLTFSADVYYDVWTDKITEQTILIPRAGTTPVFVSVYTNLGKVNLKGIEAEMTARPIDDLVINLSGAISDSKIVKGDCEICETIGGSASATDNHGNQLPFTSKYSAQASAEYSHDLGFMPHYKWFVRSEFTYKSGMYESEGNYGKTTAATNFNFRWGVRSNKVTVQAFVTNAFNNKAYTSTLPDYDLGNPSETYKSYDTIYVGLPYLRTWGLRINYDL